MDTLIGEWAPDVWPLSNWESEDEWGFPIFQTFRILDDLLTTYLSAKLLNASMDWFKGKS